jgi:single-strand selective monofunctional uracil DNA glycosylase
MKTATRKLRGDVAPLRFGAPVTHVYNPLEYAARCHEAYIDAYAKDTKKVIFLGMNPGPYGMAQTGVPFGEVALVRDWLGIEAPVGKPDPEHPKRPVLGFECKRSEVSGRRLWGTVADHFGTPKRFFARHYVANYCPLVFMEESGRNRTPDKLEARERDSLYAVCDAHLRRLVEILEPRWLVGIGAFATRRAEIAIGADGPEIGTVLHPSPANPRANRDWAGEARRQLGELGICRAASSPLKNPDRARCGHSARDQGAGAPP